MRQSRFFLFLLAVVLLSACEKPNLSTEKLKGKWEIVRGERNGNDATDAFAGGFFEFADDTSMMTNFTVTQEEERATYTLGKAPNGPITYYGPSEQIVYEVVSLTDSMMTLNTNWRNFNISLDLRRK